jgi:hypothetical protein
LLVAGDPRWKALPVPPNRFDPNGVILGVHRIQEGPLLSGPNPLQVLTAHETEVENVLAFIRGRHLGAPLGAQGEKKRESVGSCQCDFGANRSQGQR